MTSVVSGIILCKLRQIKLQVDIQVIGKLESEIHDDNEPDKIPTHHLVFCLLGYCPLGFIPTTITMMRMMMMMMMMVPQHIPTMTNSHYGGILSVMMMVGICQ